MTEKEYFKNVSYEKKYAKFPIKEGVNIFNEGG